MVKLLNFLFSAFLFFVLVYDCKAQKTDAVMPAIAIQNVLDFQQNAWNSGDLEAFMEGYWKSDSLQFIGKNIRHGWQATLDGYKKGYPDKATMGELRFDIWQTVKLANDTYLVSGKYTLIRDKDQPSGPFTLIFRLKEGKWVIVYDHTSG